MNEKQQTANELRAFAGLLRGMLAIADDLDKIGDAEAAVKAAEKRVRVLAGEEARTEQYITRLNNEVKDREQTLRRLNKELESVQEKIYVMNAPLREAAARELRKPAPAPRSFT